jgi:hypothetical protein
MMIIDDLVVEDCFDSAEYEAWIWFSYYISQPRDEGSRFHECTISIYSSFCSAIHLKRFANGFRTAREGNWTRA